MSYPDNREIKKNSDEYNTVCRYRADSNNPPKVLGRRTNAWPWGSTCELATVFKNVMLYTVRCGSWPNAHCMASVSWSSTQHTLFQRHLIFLDIHILDIFVDTWYSCVLVLGYAFQLFYNYRRSIQHTSLLWLVFCRCLEKNCTLHCNLFSNDI